MIRCGKIAQVIQYRYQKASYKVSKGSVHSPVAKTMSTAKTTPAWATIQPDRKKTMTPNMLMRQDVNTPSHVPNNTRCDIKKLVRHHGLSPWSSANISLAPDAWWPPAPYWYSFPKSTKPPELPRGLLRLYWCESSLPSPYLHCTESVQSNRIVMVIHSSL